MPEIKTKLWYGGGFTVNPDKGYSAKRQHAIVDRMFGEGGPQGSLLLPDRSPLYVGHRNGTKVKYGNGKAPIWAEGDFGIFTPAPRSKEKMPLLHGANSGGFDGNGFDDLEGFLPTAFRMILVLGRKSMSAQVTGETEEFRPIDGELREKRDYLANLAMFDAISDNSVDGAPDGWANEFSEAIRDFLGEELAEVEEAMPQEHEFKFDERPFEQFTVDMIGRFSEILR